MIHPLSWWHQLLTLRRPVLQVSKWVSLSVGTGRLIQGVKTQGPEDQGVKNTRAKTIPTGATSPLVWSYRRTLSSLYVARSSLMLTPAGVPLMSVWCQRAHEQLKMEIWRGPRGSLQHACIFFTEQPIDRFDETLLQKMKTHEIKF